MTIWTIQPLALYEKLLEQGIIHCDPEDKGFWGGEFKEFRNAYDWLVEQMKIRVGLPPMNVRYPIWAWHLMDGVSKKPDLRRMEFNGYLGDNVIIELEVPDGEVLLSDEENWHYVLSDAYLHDVRDADGNWDAVDAWFDGLPPDKQYSLKRKSWERIFDKNDADNDWQFVQATFWELKLKQIKSIRKFIGRGKR